MENPVKDFQQRSAKTVEYFQEKLSKIRTGRANPALIEDLQVDAYESKMQLKNLAAISAPEPRLLLVQPWDQSIIPNIEKAFLISNLGLSPSSDKNIIRIQIPALTTERRQDLVKVVRAELEETRMKIRGIRREVIESIEAAKKEGEISEDQETRFKDEIQKEVDKLNKQVEEISSEKETDLNEV